MPGGEQAVNVLNFAGTASDIDATLDRLESFWDAASADLSGAWRLERIDAGVYVSASSAPTSVSRAFATGAGPTGQVLGTPLPNQIALCVSFRGAGGFGRAFRGRAYLGGFAQGAQESGSGVTTGRPDPGLVTRIATAFGSLLNSSAFPTGLVVKQANSLVQNVVEEGYIDNKWDTQRRRARDLAATLRVALPT